MVSLQRSRIVIVHSFKQTTDRFLKSQKNLSKTVNIQYCLLVSIAWRKKNLVKSLTVHTWPLIRDRFLVLTVYVCGMPLSSPLCFITLAYRTQAPPVVNSWSDHTPFPYPISITTVNWPWQCAMAVWYHIREMPHHVASLSKQHTADFT